VFDPRGALPEELRDANGWRESSMRFRWWKRLEWRILGEADEVIAVSEPMAEHFAALGPRRPRLVRNGVDLDRFHVSARSPGEGEPLRLVFLVGVDVPYQAIERSADLRAAVASLWPGGATLQILSPDADAIRSRIGDKHVLCESPSRNAIPAVLADADIGLISRDASLGSRVACPVKFAEYLASGLPVIAANGIGECDAILKSGNCGVSLNMADEKCWPAALQPLVQSIQADALALRRRAREAAEKHFAWDRYLPVLRQAYGIDD
jgi:glycosyltransferase involved in cell wall biosynthesis